jgi:hypothetical protein
LDCVLVGLTVCKEVIIDETTHHATLVNCLREVRSGEFPTGPRDYVVCCILTDGLGSADLTLEINDLSTTDEIYREVWRINLADPLREEWLLITAEKVSFPSPGRYEFVIRIDGEWFAHNTVKILENRHES